MPNWTREREADAQARCDAATEGPWERDLFYVTAALDDGRQGGEVIIQCAPTVKKHRDSERDSINAAFIAHARTDLPDALDEIRRLQKELWRKEKTGTCPQCGSSWTTIGREKQDA